MKLLSHWQRPQNTRYVWKRTFYENENPNSEFHEQKEIMKQKTRGALKDLEKQVDVEKVMQEFEHSAEGLNQGNRQKIVNKPNSQKLWTGDGREKIVLKRRANGKMVLKIKDSWFKRAKLKAVDRDRDGMITSDEVVRNEGYTPSAEAIKKRTEIDEYFKTVRGEVDELKKKNVAKMGAQDLQEFKSGVDAAEDGLAKKWVGEEWEKFATTKQKKTFDELGTELERMKQAAQKRENEIAVIVQDRKLEQMKKEVGDLGKKDVSDMDETELNDFKKQVEAKKNKVKSSSFAEEQKTELIKKLDEILEKIEKREIAIKNIETDRENALIALEGLVETGLPAQADIISQLKNGTLDIDELKKKFESVGSQLKTFKESYPKMTAEQSERLKTAREKYDEKYKSVGYAETATGSVDEFEEQVKKEADQRAERVQELQADLEKAKNNELELGEEPALNELNDTDLNTLGKIQVEHMNWQIQSQVLQNHANELVAKGETFHQEFAEFEEDKKSFDMSSVTGAVLVGGFGAVGFVFGGPFGVAAGAWLGSKVAKLGGFGKNEEYETLKKAHEEVKAEFDARAPGLADYQGQLEKNAAKLKSSVSNTGAVAQKVETAKQSKTDQLAQLKNEGLPQEFIDVVATKFDTAILENLETPLETVRGDVGGDDLDTSIALNAANLENVAEVQESINSVTVEPASILDKTLGAAGSMISGWGEALYKNSDNVIIDFVGGVLDGAGELTSGIGQLVDHPENLVHLFSKSGMNALWDGLTAKEERDLGEGAAAGGKIAFNVLSIIFGGPKRAFSKVKNLVKAPGKVASKLIEKGETMGGRAGKNVAGVGERMEKVIKVGKNARSKIARNSKMVGEKVAEGGRLERSIESTTKKIKELEKKKGWRPFKKTHIRKLKVQKRGLEKMQKARSTAKLKVKKTAPKKPPVKPVKPPVKPKVKKVAEIKTSPQLKKLIEKYGNKTKVRKHLAEQKAMLKKKIVEQKNKLTGIEKEVAGKKAFVFKKDVIVTKTGNKLRPIENLKEGILKAKKELGEVTKFQKEITGMRVKPVKPPVKPVAAAPWKPVHVAQGAGLIVGGQAGEQLSRNEDRKKVEEKEAVVVEDKKYDVLKPAE